MARLSHRTVRLLAGRPIVMDGQTLAPHIQLALKAMDRCGQERGKAPGAEARVREARRTALVTARPLPRVGGGGPHRAWSGRAVAARVLRRCPARPGDGPQPALVFFHGGGFVFGDLDSDDELCRMLCWHARVTVIAIDYRLAPENPFPAAVDDAIRGLRAGFTATPRPTGSTQPASPSVATARAATCRPSSVR